jgi:hypothetical protein
LAISTDPELDLAEHAIEAIVPRAALKAAGDGLGLAQRDLGQNAADRAILNSSSASSATRPRLTPCLRLSIGFRALAGQ